MNKSCANVWEINKTKIDNEIEKCEDCIFMKNCEWHKAMILGYLRCEEDFRIKDKLKSEVEA